MTDLIFIFGMLFLSYGSWLVYKPAGYLVVGIILLIVAVMMAISNSRSGNRHKTSENS